MTVVEETLETKPFYLSSEFYLTIFAAFWPAVDLAGITDWLGNWHSGILLTIIAAAYAVARGNAKSHVPYTRKVQR